MKNYKNLLFVFAVSFLSIHAIAQKKGKGAISNKYDLNNRVAETIKPANHNQMTTYEISNVNRFIYDVTINGTLVSFNTAVPAVFNQIFQQESIEDSSIPEAIESLPKSTDATKNLVNLEFELLATKSNIQSIERQEATGVFEIFKTYDFQFDLPNQTKNDSLLAEFRLEKKRLEALIKATKVSKYDSIFTEVTQASMKVDRIFDSLEKAKFLKNALVNLSQTNKLDASIATKKIKELEENIIGAKNLQFTKAYFDDAVNEFNKRYQEYLSSPEAQTEFNGDSEKIIKSVKKLKDEVDRIDGLAQKTDYTKIAQDIVVIKSELLNPNSYVAISNPIQATEDDVKFEIKITPKATVNKNLHTTTTNFTTHIPVKGGVKIDFSTGFITTGLLHNRSYSSTIARDSSSFTISQNKNRNIANFNVGAFMHVYKSNATNCQLAGTFGIGLNSKTLDDVDFYLGGSAIFGRKNRFVVTAGAALSHVDYLKGSFNIDEAIDITKYSDDLTERAIRIGAFLALSYNLSK